MNNEQFTEMMESLIKKLDTGKGSHIDAIASLAKRNEVLTEFKGLIDALIESLGVTRIALGYLLFDLEATRRERDQLRTMLEDKN